MFLQRTCKRKLIFTSDMLSKALIVDDLTIAIEKKDEEWILTLLKQLDETKDSIYLEDYLTIQNSNNIEKLLQLESIEICKQISLLEKTLFNRYYNIIVTNCSVDFINQLIETNIFDIQKITQNNADNYLILL